MNKDLLIVKEILSHMHIVEPMVNVLIDNLKSKLSERPLQEITPNFLYTVFAYELGKKYATEISEQFQFYKEHGRVRTIKDLLKSRYS